MRWNWAPQTPRCRCCVFLKKVSRSGVFIERAGLKLLDPDLD
jgi:hypothetical protein